MRAWRTGLIGLLFSHGGLDRKKWKSPNKRPNGQGLCVDCFVPHKMTGIFGHLDFACSPGGQDQLDFACSPGDLDWKKWKSH